ncbi:MAG: hypothetical protein ACREEK_33645 [Bradyrhizobium sp.]
MFIEISPSLMTEILEAARPTAIGAHLQVMPNKEAAPGGAAFGN